MTKKILSGIKELFGVKKQQIYTLTYYIPSPKQNHSIYREKQFDSLVEKIVSKGVEILTLNTAENNNSAAPGMWVIMTVKSNNPTTILSENISEEMSDSPVEGLYQVNPHL